MENDHEDTPVTHCLINISDSGWNGSAGHVCPNDQESGSRGGGGGKWLETGVTADVDEWTKVVIVIDVSKERWKLKLPEKNYVSPDQKYRGVPKQLLMINYLTETQPGVFIDALQIRRAQQD